jgi:cellulose 1,4-beta-cellobiosidase
MSRSENDHPTVLLARAFVLIAAFGGAGCGGATQPAAVPTQPTPAPGQLPMPTAAAATAPVSTPETSNALPPPSAPAGVTKTQVQVTPPAREGNPFVGAHFYVDPAYVAEVEASIKRSPGEAALLKKVEAFPTSIWLSSVKAVGGVGKTLDDAAAVEKKAGAPVVTVFTVYDLPERDCAAAASNGELTIANGGEKRYQKDFIDKIAAAFKAHPKQRIVAVIEPDSLANLATNMSVAKCAAAEQVYKHSVAYAIKELSMPNVSLYLDAAHAGWLAWSKNREKITKIYGEVLADAGGNEKIRGFATNVSNYDSLTGGDLAKLEPSDPSPDELSYVQLLDASLSEAGITGKGFVIDTSRNGRSGIRTKSGSWCNIRGAGIGERPQAAPSPLVDAYFWIKPPGESDGGADPAKPGFDENCGGAKAPDSAPGAPRAGQWFGSYFIDLAKNANPPL